MSLGKEQYFSVLSGTLRLDHRPLDALKALLDRRLELEDSFPTELLAGTPGRHQKITEFLSRLDLGVVKGPEGWGGLVVGFPGSAEQLTTRSVGTPYLRQILYPMLDLHTRLGAKYGTDLPCLYILGPRFPDVFLRKFDLLLQVIPNVIVLTSGMLEARNRRAPARRTKLDEKWAQAELCQMMDGDARLALQHEGADALRLRYLAHELPTGEGTQNPERLDILAVDETDKSLVAFEIKGPDAQRVDLENLLLQGLEHRNWLERNKRAAKLLFDDGPKGRTIDVRKRVRLLLGFFGDYVPPHFKNLAAQAKRYDPYLRIDLVQLSEASTDGTFTRLDAALRV